MDITLVGDFADPLSFLASQRVAKIASLGVHRVQWVAVEADRACPMSGRPLSAGAAGALRECGLAGETIPAAGARIPNSCSATAAYAESLSDGVADAMRRALFDAAWVARLCVDDPEVIRGIVSGVLNPNRPVRTEARIRANAPIVPLGDPDPIAVTRRLGFIVSIARGPLTEAGHQRVKDWRALWRQHGEPMLPLVVTSTGDRLASTAALAWLAAQLPIPDAGILETNPPLLAPISAPGEH